ncbi:MAG: phytanoyl-CoA dioxygenase family protein [Ktedonobacteraceae bacterium]|nr:phytanoyl-CoA dioxygenase family protein [Ktedonobacteraceae bacterium]
MDLKVLSEAQVEHFIEYGYVQLEEAFPREKALAVQDYIWQQAGKLGVLRNDRSTWTIPRVHIKETYRDPVFRECATQRLADAIEDLLGRDRWAKRDSHTTDGWGWWPINFSVGADKPWDVPTEGWHWDGQQFRHYVDSPDQGLLLLCVFSDIAPHGGGTAVAEGSHNIVARYLRQFSNGIEHKEALSDFKTSHPWIAELVGQKELPPGKKRVDYFMSTHTDADGFRLRVVDTTAKAGDVFMCHPFLYHASAPNHSGIPRFICNRTTPLKERMNFQRSDGNYSPVELSIRKALQI